MCPLPSRFLAVAQVSPNLLNTSEAERENVKEMSEKVSSRYLLEGIIDDWTQLSVGHWEEQGMQAYPQPLGLESWFSLGTEAGDAGFLILEAEWAVRDRAVRNFSLPSHVFVVFA